MNKKFLAIAGEAAGKSRMSVQCSAERKIRNEGGVDIPRTACRKLDIVRRCKMAQQSHELDGPLSAYVERDEMLRYPRY